MAHTSSKRGNGKHEETKGGETSGQARETGLAPRHTGMRARQGGFEPLHQLRMEFDRLFDRFFTGWPAMRGEWEAGWRLDVDEEDQRVVVRAEAPGFEASDFDVEVRGDELVLRARHEAREDEGDSHQWSEREIYRTVSLPRGTDPDHVDAQYRQGVLTISIPKTEQGQQRHIEVKG